MNTFLESGAPERKKLDKVRSNISDLDGELEQIENGYCSAEEAELRLMSELQSLRSRSSVALALPQISRFTPDHDYLSLLNQPLTIGGLIELLGEEQITAALLPKVKAACKGGLSRQEAAARRKQIAEQRRKLQFDDEREVIRLESEGYLVDRPYFDPAIALAVWDAD